MAIFGDFLRLVFSASRVQQVSDLHLKLALRPHHVWKYGGQTVANLSYCWPLVHSRIMSSVGQTSWTTSTRCLRTVHWGSNKVKRLIYSPSAGPKWLVLSSSLLGRQPAGDVSYEPSSKLPLLATTPAVIFPTAERHHSWPAPISTAWWTEGRVWTACLYGRC